MQHFILRCKHCQKEYTYCTYGNGPEYGTEKGCSMDYCAECQTAIDKALGKIEKKFEGRYMEINEPRLYPILDNIRRAEEKRRENKENFFPMVVCTGDCGKFDNAEIYTHLNKKYVVRWNDDAPEDKHLFIEMEYDLTKKEFTNRPWKQDKHEDSYRKSRNSANDLIRALSEHKVGEVYHPEPMSEPIGQLFFTDLNFDTEPLKFTPPPKPHALSVNHYTDTGAGLKIRAEHGWYQTRVELGEGVSLDNLIDYIDYKYTVEKYMDEDVAKITKIECA